jgi:hypothetical protein
MAIAALAVAAMLLVGIARMHESYAPGSSPVEFSRGGEPAVERWPIG